ncbi:hypothetical protein FOZ62_012114, partial [Perkinsus olseni]
MSVSQNDIAQLQQQCSNETGWRDRDADGTRIRGVASRGLRHTIFITALTFKGGNSADVLPFPPQHFMGAIGQIPPQGPVLDGERSPTLLKQLPTSTKNWAMRSRVTAVSQKRSG